MQEVRQNSVVKAHYLWGADGRKLNVFDATLRNSYDYMGSLVLAQTNGIWSGEAYFAEGVIRDGQTTYFEKDHLGSVRVTASASGTILGRNDYTPFGKRHSGIGIQVDHNNRYLFNGKEDQVIGGLGLLDYGWRMYDPELARWFGIDRLSEKYRSFTPYGMVAGNPLRNIELDGRKWVDANGNLVWSNGSWTQYASADAIRLGNNLMQTHTGSRQFETLVNSELPVQVVYNTTDAPRVMINGEDGVLGGLAQVEGTQNPRTGKKTVESATITIYGLNSEEMAKIASRRTGWDVTLEQMESAMFGHEIEHTTNENQNTPKSTREDRPKEVESQILKDYERQQPMDPDLLKLRTHDNTTFPW